MEKWKKSEYLKVIDRRTDFAVYHSLFGNLCLIDRAGMKILDFFNENKEIEELRNKISCKEDFDRYIKELQERSFLVKDGLDERDIIETDKKNRKMNCASGYLVRALQLVMSNTCNFKCKYCFEKNMYKTQKRIEHQNSKTNQYMSFDVAKMAVENTIKILEKNGNKVLNIEFFGGEPLINWPVIKQVIEYFGNGTGDKVSIKYSITTNGSLITEEMSKLFKKYGVTVTISFDSPKNIDRIRLDGKSAMELLIPKLKILKDDRNWVTFNSVISKETIELYDGYGLVNLAKENNISMIGLILDLDLEFYKDNSNKNTILEKLWDTYNYSIQQGIEITGYWYQIYNQIIGKQDIMLDTGYKTCPATGCKLSVEPEGHVYICKCCSEYIGNISEITQVLSSKKYEEYAMRVYENSPQCKGCEIEGFCSGVCMGGLEKKYGTMYGREISSCDIFKEITRKLIYNVKDADVLFFEDETFIESKN